MARKWIHLIISTLISSTNISFFERDIDLVFVYVHTEACRGGSCRDLPWASDWQLYRSWTSNQRVNFEKQLWGFSSWGAGPGHLFKSRCWLRVSTTSTLSCVQKVNVQKMGLSSLNFSHVHRCSGFLWSNARSVLCRILPFSCWLTIPSVPVGLLFLSCGYHCQSQLLQSLIDGDRWASRSSLRPCFLRALIMPDRAIG